MGIQGLLPLLKSIHKSCSLKSFEGKTLGIDAYGWMHRGVVACAFELAMGKPTRKFVDYTMNRVRMLQHFGVTPFLIFDGDYLPSKAATEENRAKRREQNRQVAFNFLNAGKISQANLAFQKSLDVTPEMAHQLIEELKINGVKFIVAPYEADPQMVYLERKGIIDGIISEDSDLLVFGAQCLLTKMDQYGNCIELNKADFSACKEINLAGWSDVTFRHMAILSGCDYLPSIRNMGLRTAHSLMRKYKTIEKVVQFLKFDGKFHVPENYLESFRQAELTFLHQRVFCPQIMGLVTHTQPAQSIDLEKMPFIGAFIDPEIAVGVARGDLNPTTKLPYTPETKGMANQLTYENALSLSSLTKGISINKYFKKRVPLAEVNPNRFTPSDSQRGVLERNYGGWMSSPAHPQYQSPKKIVIENECTDIPLTNSKPRSAKRLRSCVETDLISDEPTEYTSSPYFASQTQTLNLQKDIKFGPQNSEDTSIFSDDSIEEAMLGLPFSCDSEVSQDSPELIPVKENQNQERVDYSHHLDVLPSRKKSVNTLNLKVGLNSAPKGDSEKENCSSLKSNASLLIDIPINQKSSDKASLSRISITSTDTKLPLKSQKSKVVLGTDSVSSRPSKASVKSRLTPLQRLSIIASNQSKPSSSVKNKSVLNPFFENLLSKNKNPNSFQHQLKSKSIDPLNVSYCFGNESMNTFIGSEDLIIHDSEDEDEFSS